MPLTVEPALRAGTLGRIDQPVLRAGGLTLRPWQEADAGTLARAYADSDIQRWHARTMDEREAAEWVASRASRWRADAGADWAVTGDDAVLGRVGLRRIDLDQGLAEVLFWVLPEARGRGVASTALLALTDWAFGEIGFHRLELEHSAANAGSCAVAGAAGYPLEGTKRASVRHADGWHDMHLHARVAT